MKRRTILSLLLLTLLVISASAAPDDPYWSTFSIIAYDPAAGMAGIAIASSTWTEHASDILTPGISPDAGIIVSQAAVLPRNYARGVQLLKEGKNAQEVIEILKQEDPAFESRQIAVVDRSGGSGAFSGKDCLSWAGSSGGPFFSAQGNILVNAETVPAMAAAFRRRKGNRSPTA